MEKSILLIKDLVLYALTLTFGQCSERENKMSEEFDSSRDGGDATEFQLRVVFFARSTLRAFRAYCVEQSDTIVIV